MNILFYCYNSICEQSVIRGFKELGHSVDTLTIEVINKDTTAKECAESVRDALLSSSYDFVFSINFYPVISEVCNIFKILYLSWIVDSPILELFSDSVKHPYNRIFLFDEALYLDFSTKNPSCIFHLPLAADVTLYDSICSSALQKDRDYFSSKISFVGSLYTEKCPYDALVNPPDYVKGFLSGIMETQLRIYGSYLIDELLSKEIVEEFINHTPDIYRFPAKAEHNYTALISQFYIGNKITSMERTRFLTMLSELYPVDIFTASDTTSISKINNRGKVQTITEMPLVFQNSTINLNMTSKSIRSGIPLRIWDVLGCKGFLISNYQAEIPHLFEPGSDLETYGSFAELEDKIHYYLDHPEIAAEIAASGYEKVKKYHTYPMRLEQMLEKALV